ELLDGIQRNRSISLRAGWTFTSERLVDEAQLVRRRALEDHLRASRPRGLDEFMETPGAREIEHGQLRRRDADTPLASHVDGRQSGIDLVEAQRAPFTG